MYFVVVNAYFKHLCNSLAVLDRFLAGEVIGDTDDAVRSSIEAGGGFVGGRRRGDMAPSQNSLPPLSSGNGFWDRARGRCKEFVADFCECELRQEVGHDLSTPASALGRRQKLEFGAKLN